MAGVTALALRGIGTAPDFVHDFLTDTWIHPDTGVVIFGEDMPRELIAWCHLNPEEET